MIDNLCRIFNLCRIWSSFHCYKFIPLGYRSTLVWTTCSEWLCNLARNQTCDLLIVSPTLFQSHRCSNLKVAVIISVAACRNTWRCSSRILLQMTSDRRQVVRRFCSTAQRHCQLPTVWCQWTTMSAMCVLTLRRLATLVGWSTVLPSTWFMVSNWVWYC